MKPKISIVFSLVQTNKIKSSIRTIFFLTHENTFSLKVNLKKTVFHKLSFKTYIGKTYSISKRYKKYLFKKMLYYMNKSLIFLTC